MANMRKICEILTMDDPIAGASHDVVYLDAGGEIDPESDIGKALTEAGAFYADEYDSWVVWA
jgi:hypothetical protein